MYKLLYLIFLIFTVSCSSIERLPKESLKDLLEIRDSFVGAAKKLNVEIPFNPGIKEWTRPSIISWRENQNVVAVPVWSQLSAEQLRLIKTMTGDLASSKKLFTELFRWFLIPHELTHAYQSALKTSSSPYQTERKANDVATAFYMSEGLKYRLDKLEKILEIAQAKLPPSRSEKYFNQNYQKMGSELELYAAYQINFILSSLKRRNKLHFKKEFRSALNL